MSCQHKADTETWVAEVYNTPHIEPWVELRPMWCVRCGALVVFDMTDPEHPKPYAPERVPESGDAPARHRTIETSDGVRIRVPDDTRGEEGS